MHPPSGSSPPSAAASPPRLKSFLAWLAVVPVLGGLCAIGVSQLPLWFTYLLPYVLVAASLVILVAAVATGAATRTLGASMGGLVGGIGLLLLIFSLVDAAGRADWKASREEFQTFSQVVARGDPKAIASALGDLRRFTPAEALCVLGSDNGDGGSGYLMPSRPEAQRNKMGRGFFISTPKLFEVAEVVVSMQPAKRETQVALYEMLRNLHWRDDGAAFPRWEQLWLRTKAATGGTPGWHFDGARSRSSSERCGADDDTGLADWVAQVTQPPETPEQAQARQQRRAEQQQELDEAVRKAQADALRGTQADTAAPRQAQTQTP